MAGSTIAVPSITPDLTDVDRWFAFDGRQEVFVYLDRHPHLVPLLVDVATAVQRFFPADDELVLHVIDDADTQTEQLYAIVRTILPPDEAEARLDRLDEEWWLDAVELARGNFTIDVESR